MRVVSLTNTRDPLINLTPTNEEKLEDLLKSLALKILIKHPL